MIEMEDELCMVKEIVLTGADNLEKVVASSNMSDKINFTSMTHHKAFAFVSREDQHNNEINHVPPKYLPHLGQSLPVEEYAKDDGLAERIRDILEEGDVAPKKMIETPGIRDAKSKEQVLNWTSTPLFISRST